ncbi:GSU2403 family nucleotidyltransferase fold protein [Caulobacter segnis]
MTLQRLPLAIHTNVAELLDQLRAAQIAEFGEGASFLRRERKGRFYWVCPRAPDPRRSPRARSRAETPELLETIESAKAAKTAAKDRAPAGPFATRRRPDTPRRQDGPDPERDGSGRRLPAAAAVVGTVAFQTYGAALGFVLPSQAVRTGDLDIRSEIMGFRCLLTTVSIVPSSTCYHGRPGLQPRAQAGPTARAPPIARPTAARSMC